MLAKRPVMKIAVKATTSDGPNGNNKRSLYDG
jgi:hypothetical protein